MQMSHFTLDLQHSLTRFHKSTMDTDTPRVPNQRDAVDCEDRLSAVNETPDGPQSLISEGHVAPVPPYDKETMFEKPLTPSDVGKLNRLVIPKQYAEKYLPLGGGDDSAGTLLGFEDEAGKCWRFRYSYWNSSQSYVLTKGWSRYVKEKCLDAADVVVFERHRAEPERLFIGWRRRGAVPPQPTAFCYNAQGYGIAQDSRRGVVGVHPYQGDRRRVAGGAKQEEEVALGNGNSNSRRLVRLFGVNFECQLSQAQSPSSGTTSSQASNSHHQQQQQHPIQTQQHPQEEAYRNYFNYMHGSFS